MHWGHASSADLVAWADHPIALAPDERGTVYSGSAVVDAGDTAGLGPGALVVAFTRHRDGVEEQSLAWSTDGGETFTERAEPVLEAPPGQGDFRDPRLLRHPGDPRRWAMLLAAGHAVWIYTSPDLVDWTRTGTVTGVFSEAGTWEMPDLLRFDVDGSDVWVLVVSIADGAPAGGSGVQAVAGTFDGSTFTPAGEPFWVDHGPDFYAPQAWTDAPDGRRIWVGWTANWHRVYALPAGDWRGQMSIPREVSLRAGDHGPRLVQEPVGELASYRERSLVASGGEVGEHLGSPLPVTAPALDVVLGLAPGATGEVRGRRGPAEVEVRVDREVVEVRVVDREAAPGSEGGSGEARYRAPRPPADGLREVRVLLDTASMEVFAGGATISVLLPGSGEPWAVEVGPPGEGAGIDRIEVHALRAAGPAAGRA